MKRKKRAVRFRAALPLKLSQQVEYVSKKKWGTLPENERGTEIVGRWKNYYHRIPPYDNPAVAKLRRRLSAKRIEFFEWIEPVDGVQFVHFSTFPEDKLI